MEGPLVSIHMSWPVMDAWRTTIFPSFPKPDPATCALRSTEMAVSVKAGEGKRKMPLPRPYGGVLLDSFLFWMWTDLCVLERMRQLRLQLASGGEPVTETGVDQLLASALHPTEYVSRPAIPFYKIKGSGPV